MIRFRDVVCLLLVATLTLHVAGCSTPPHSDQANQAAARVHVGMQRAAVSHALGEPHSTFANPHGVLWLYEFESSPNPGVYFLHIVGVTLLFVVLVGALLVIAAAGGGSVSGLGGDLPDGPGTELVYVGVQLSGGIVEWVDVGDLDLLHARATQGAEAPPERD